MIKVEILNKTTQQITNTSEFIDILTAEAWVDLVSPTGAFGKPDRWLSANRFTLDSETIESALETRLVQSIIEYRFSAEFEVVYTDITAEKLARKESDDALRYLNDTDWLVIRSMETGELVPKDIEIARTNARRKVLK